MPYLILENKNLILFLNLKFNFMKRRGLIFNSRPNKTAVFALGLMLGLCPVLQIWAFDNANENQVVLQSHKQVKGQIVDAMGEPIIGASILEKGTTNGVISDIDGNFSLNVSAPNAIIVISYIGFKSMEFPASHPSLKRIVMKEDTEVLDEVVVVGYGTQKKESLTGAVTVVGAKQLENKGTMSSPLQAMQGTVPGVIITRNSGAPGDESWGMKLRGAVSTNSTDPLVIVDGVEYNDGINGLRLLNTEDIESINFLKDASAAIYGSKAAGGVVLVTTKKAKAGKTVIQYDGSFTGKVIGMQPEMMTMNQWADAVILAMNNDGNPDINWAQYAKLALMYKNKYIDLDYNSHPIPGSFTDVADFVFQDNDWQDIMWGNSWSTQHNLSVSGGNEKNLFRLSFGYMYDNSTLQWGNNNNARYNMRLNDQFEISKNVKLITDIAYNRQDQVVPSTIGAVLSQSNPQPGLPYETIDGRPYAWGTWRAPNWLAELGGDNKLKVSAINISEALNWKIYSDLDAVVNLGYNTSTATRDIQNLPIDWYNYAGTKVVRSEPTQANSSYENSFARTDYYMTSGYLNWHKSFLEAHNVSVMAGLQYSYTQYKYTKTVIKDIKPALEVPNGQGEKTISGEKWHEAMMSYFGRLNYDYKGRYLVEGNLRYDGSSKFRPENRWKFFWGVSGGWRLSEESFMQPLSSVFSNLKLRLSYGVLGNQSGIDRYDGTQLYKFESSSGAYIGNGKVSTIDTNGKIVTTSRTWEQIHSYNLGLDFGLLNNRLTGTVEIFLKKNNNMLIAAQYAGILGDQAPATNIGKFEAKGWDGNLTWSDKIGKVNYHVGGTITYATNKLIDLGATSVLSSGYQATQQGYPLNSYFGLRYCGKIQTEEQLKKYLYYYQNGNGIGMPANLRLGDNMFEDVNNDGKLDQNDYVYLGTDDPKLSYSLNAGAEWNGFDLSVIFQGVGRRTIFRDASNNNWRIPMSAPYMNQPNWSIGNTWSKETPNAYYPSYTYAYGDINTYNYQCSSWSVENGAYIRLKNITLGYTFPTAWIAKTHVLSKLRVYFTGADLWEHSKIRDGWDPEQSRKTEALGRYPFNRTFTVGVNATF